MSQKKRTPEERFLLQAYDMASEQGGYDSEIPIFEVVSALGISPKKAKTTLQALCQGNFVKKRGGLNMVVTKHGQGLVEELRS